MVETPGFRTELLLSNRGTSAADLTLDYRESLSRPLGAGGAATGARSARAANPPGSPSVPAQPRDPGRAGRRGVLRRPAPRQRSAPGRPASTPPSASPPRPPAGAPTASSSPGVAAGDEATDECVLTGLRAEADVRSNVAFVHAGAAGFGTGHARGSALRRRERRQPRPARPRRSGSRRLPGSSSPTRSGRPGSRSGWARVRRTAGTAPWIAYGVLNDGGAPGRTDRRRSAYVPASRAPRPFRRPGSHPPTSRTSARSVCPRGASAPSHSSTAATP